MSLNLTIFRESWPLRRPFSISRGTKEKADVVVIEISDGKYHGRSECVPYLRYGETVDGVVADIEFFFDVMLESKSQSEFLTKVPPGAARNALDNAYWDYSAKSVNTRVWKLIGLSAPKNVVTAETIGVDTQENMAKEARRLKNAPLIKVKLNNKNVISSVVAVRENAPQARIIVDPNEGWSFYELEQFSPILKDLNIEMIEQPVPAKDDFCLLEYECPVDICADESCHTLADLPKLIGKYQMINIKLDKSGGISAAIELEREARAAGFKIMIGCMIGTSLSMAPATLIAHNADVVDLDGPLLLKSDREFGLNFCNGLIGLPDAKLWG